MITKIPQLIPCLINVIMKSLVPLRLLGIFGQ